MTDKQFNRAVEIKSGIDWCNDVVHHTANNHKLTLKFTSSDSCIESTDLKACPKWLVDIIEHAVIEHRAKLYEEFAGL